MYITTHITSLDFSQCFFYFGWEGITYNTYFTLCIKADILRKKPRVTCHNPSLTCARVRRLIIYNKNINTPLIRFNHWLRSFLKHPLIYTNTNHLS